MSRPRPDVAERRRKNKEEWFKSNGPCVDCGSWDKLELDHIDPKTKNPILVKRSDRIWHWGEARRKEELDKCVVRCHTCHKAKTAANNESTRLGIDGALEVLTDEDMELIYNEYGSGRYTRVELCRRWGIARHTLKFILGE